MFTTVHCGACKQEPAKLSAHYKEDKQVSTSVKPRSVGTSSLLRKLDRDIAQTELEKQAAEEYLSVLYMARKKVSRTVLAEVVSITRPHKVSRTALLRNVLEDAGGPMSVADMMHVLHQQGRDDDRKLVYATLSYLKRLKLAKRNKDGTWSATARQRRKGSAVAA